MYVNPFWFGVLMTIVAGVMIMIVLAIIQAVRDDGDDEDFDLTPDQYKQMLKELTGKDFVVEVKHGCMVAHPVEEEKDGSSDKE